MWKSILLILLSISTCAQARDVWSPEKANEWFKKQPYRAGVNYVPSYAINSIEFWQNESFNIDVIEKELALMSSVGFNAVRIFLSDIVWKYQEREAMKNLESCFMAAGKTSYENRKPKELPDGLDGKRKSNRAVDPVRINRPVFRWEQKFFRRDGSRPLIIRNCVTE